MWWPWSRIAAASTTGALLGKWVLEKLCLAGEGLEIDSLKTLCVLAPTL